MMNAELQEKELLKAASQGHVKAFETIFFRYHPRLIGFLDSLIHDREASRDLAQELFLSLWKEREKLYGVHSFSAYLYRMARYRVYDYFDHLIITERYAYEYLRHTSEEISEEEQLFAQELQVVINQVVAQFPPQRQLIYRLSREQGLSNEEIAQRLGISKRTVENHLTTALAALRKVIFLLVVLRSLPY